jgi:hypothetical protein
MLYITTPIDIVLHRHFSHCITMYSVYILILLIFWLCNRIRHTFEPPPKIFMSRNVIIHTHKLLLENSISPSTPLHRLVLPLETFLFLSALPLRFVSLQETYESCIASPYTLILLQGLSTLRTRIDFVEKHQT